MNFGKREIEFPEALLGAINEMARHRGISVDQWVREACVEKLPKPILRRMPEEQRRALIDSVEL